MKEVKRYDIYMHSDDVQFLRECPEGDYVRFGDFDSIVKELEGKLKVAVTRLKDAEQALSRTYDLQEHPGEGSDCDTEMARNRVRATIAQIDLPPPQPLQPLPEERK